MTSGFFIFAALLLVDNVIYRFVYRWACPRDHSPVFVSPVLLWAQWCRPVQRFSVMSQSWPLSQEANKSSGVCSVCLATRQLHLRDGTFLHRHGPRDSPCPGSNTLPLSVTAQRGKSGFISDQPALSAKADKSTPGSSGPSSQLSDRPIWTPPDHALIKHIPQVCWARLAPRIWRLC